MKKYRKSCMLGVLFMVMMAVTACGSEGESEIQVIEEPEKQPEYLSFFSSESYRNNDVVKYWSDEFTKEYNKQIYINFDGASYYADEGLSYRELLEKRLSSSAPDDMYIINAEDVLDFEKKGYWMDLSDMDFVDNLSESALYQSTYNEKVFSVPLCFTGFGFVWNVDMLTELGLSIPENLDEFMNVCEVVKENGILPYGANKGYSLTVPAMGMGFSKLYKSQDVKVQIEDLNSGERNVSEYVREGFEFLSLMIEKGYMDPEQALNTTPKTTDVEGFYNGEYAFICTSLGEFIGDENQSFYTETTGLPILPEGSVSVFGADKRLCVNPNSKHLEVVKEFIEMVGSKEALEASAELEKTVSSAKDADLNRFTNEKKLATLLTEPGQIPNQDFGLHFNTWESIRDISREICSGTSIDEACRLLDEKQQADLEEYSVKE